MQNRYTGDIGDFGKFLLLKHLFPDEKIATIWYLYPDESHNTDGSHRVEEGNLNLYRKCQAIDPQMAELFNIIHSGLKRHIGLFEELGVLSNGSYFGEGIVGEGEAHRANWLERATAFITQQGSRVVCLDPDNGIEPSSMNKLSVLKQGKYATYSEIDAFFSLGPVQHLVIYQHFHRQCSHETQMQDANAKFETLYEGRATVAILRHNAVQARFYIILSKQKSFSKRFLSVESLKYGTKPFFSILRTDSKLR